MSVHTPPPESAQPACCSSASSVSQKPYHIRQLPSECQRSPSTTVTDGHCHSPTSSAFQRLPARRHLNTAAPGAELPTPCVMETPHLHPPTGFEMGSAALLDPRWWQYLSSCWQPQSPVISVEPNPGAVQQVGDSRQSVPGTHGLIPLRFQGSMLRNKLVKLTSCLQSSLQGQGQNHAIPGSLGSGCQNASASMQSHSRGVIQSQRPGT